uniref:Protein TIC 214 n=1 Tax=Coleochaete scutata TaxID=3125 RepID=A0A191T5Q2_COLSC|nr:hypothetical chloroplast RF1 [Coleochaete scutata]ANI25719.1 hypothetical chloroplast RF1 [Coleochaete scutata]
MITISPTFLSILWHQIPLLIAKTEPLFLFGLYYGLLATLPLSLSHMLFIRNRLLEGPISAKMTMAGLLIGQLSIIFSIYFTPFYVAWTQPHFISFLAIPYMLCHWQRIRYLQHFETLREIKSWNDWRLVTAFLDSFLLQLLNPILLPNPVLARFINVFFFRYSNNFIFLIGTFCGWLTGYTILYKLTVWFRNRLEKDANVIYPLLKLLIHRTFIPIVFASWLLYIGKFSQIPWQTMRLFKSKFVFNKSWPDIIFDHNRLHRPFRTFAEKTYEITYDSGKESSIRKGIPKQNTSQFFFEECVSDGNRRISYTYPWTIAILHKDLKNILRLPNLSQNHKENIYKEWQSRKFKRKLILNNLILGKIQNLSHLNLNLGSKILISKKRSSFYKSNILNKKYNIFSKTHDSRLKTNSSTLLRKSAWIPTELISISNSKSSSFFLKRNKLKNWISKKWQKTMPFGLIPPWDIIKQQTIYNLLLKINKDLKLKNLDKNSLNKFQSTIDITDALLIDWDISKNENNISNKEISWIGFLKKFPKKDRKIILETIDTKSFYNLDKLLNFKKVYQFTGIQLQKLPLLQKDNKYVNQKNISSEIIKINQLSKLSEIYKELPVKNILYKDIVDGNSDIRVRELKNTAYVRRKNEEYEYRVLRFSTKPDFRMRLPKGSLRARRRKKFIWKLFHSRVNSPFFLRLKESIHESNLIPKFRGSNVNLKILFENLSSTIQNQPISTNFQLEMRRQELLDQWDKTYVHLLRGPALIFQAFFRRYVKLPIFITLKNIGRKILGQTLEWDLDWEEWLQESYLFCQYDGIELPRGNWPSRWCFSGIQVKIINPFQLKPWHKSSKQLKKHKIKSSYLTVLGSQEKFPFGEQVYYSSFWKPVQRETKKWLYQKVYIPTLKIEEGMNKFFQKWTQKIVKIDYFNKPIQNNFDIVELHKSDILKEKSHTSNQHASMSKLDKTNVVDKIPLIEDKKSNQFISDNSINSKLDINFNKNIEDYSKLAKTNESLNNVNQFKNNHSNNIIEINQKITKNKNSSQLKTNIIFSKKKSNILQRKIAYPIQIQLLNLHKKISILNKNFIYLKQQLLNWINYSPSSIRIFVKRKMTLTYIKFVKVIQNIMISLQILIRRINESVNKIFLKKDYNSLSISKTNEIENLTNKKEYLHHSLNDQNISQADILYKTWEILLKRKPSLTSIIQNWNPDFSIMPFVESSFAKEGLLQIDRPEIISDSQWKEWLQLTYRYIPSRSVWEKIMANLWKLNIENNLQNKNNVLSDLNNKFLINSNPNWISNFKKTSFFEKIQRSVKKKRLEILSHEFLNLNNIPKINDYNLLSNITNRSIFVNKNNKFVYKDKSIQDRQFFRRFISRWWWKNKQAKKIISDLINDFNLKEADALELVNLLHFNAPIFTENFLRKWWYHPIPSVLDDETLVYRMIITNLFTENKLNLQKPNSIYSISQLNELLDEKLYFYLFSPEELLTSSMQREFMLLNSLNVEKNLEDKKITIHNNNALLNQKILSFQSKFNINNKNMKKYYNNKNYIKSNTKLFSYINNSQKIKRFIWASYRLEDLACMNRFWFNTANGTRFGSLRIRMYPII